MGKVHKPDPPRCAHGELKDECATHPDCPHWPIQSTASIEPQADPHPYGRDREVCEHGETRYIGSEHVCFRLDSIGRALESWLEKLTTVADGMPGVRAAVDAIREGVEKREKYVSENASRLKAVELKTGILEGWSQSVEGCFLTRDQKHGELERRIDALEGSVGCVTTGRADEVVGPGLPKWRPEDAPLKSADAASREAFSGMDALWKRRKRDAHKMCMTADCRITEAENADLCRQLEAQTAEVARLVHVEAENETLVAEVLNLQDRLDGSQKEVARLKEELQQSQAELLKATEDFDREQDRAIVLATKLVAAAQPAPRPEQAPREWDDALCNAVLEDVLKAALSDVSFYMAREKERFSYRRGNCEYTMDAAPIRERCRAALRALRLPPPPRVEESGPVAPPAPPMCPHPHAAEERLTWREDGYWSCGECSDSWRAGEKFLPGEPLAGKKEGEEK